MGSDFGEERERNQNLHCKTSSNKSRANLFVLCTIVLASSHPLKRIANVNTIQPTAFTSLSMPFFARLIAEIQTQTQTRPKKRWMMRDMISEREKKNLQFCC